ncbi:hypothetical protein PtA15_6A494 [Puccinia triticina]|uniref:Surfeit locus protein 4 n=1 Tax=Puccinia triticina TaxID=208348 RepID=A0ABY7CQ04_9BASI|nr:uncharacterized protein PtA15_6A494 [Puccinia triticina]WAQ85865.1 hypothetical protein PtA15_6A494 [Puccinia triticina]
MASYAPLPQTSLGQRLHAHAAAAERALDRLSRPLKPHINKLARFLLVSTFIEDALRISNQFHEQKDYLIDDQEYPDWFVLMVGCSVLIVFKKWALFAVLGLAGVIVSQGWVYELLTDGTFVCLNLSIMGALMLALSDALAGASGSSRRGVLAGLPDISEDAAVRRQTYLQLAGRLLLVVFFVGHALAAYLELAAETLSLVNLLAAAFAFLACILVAVGFKAAWSATFLVILTSVVNVLSNDWWAKPKDHPERDFRRFDFFQALSVVGGMILLINQGPGGISFDAKRKSI